MGQTKTWRVRRVFLQRALPFLGEARAYSRADLRGDIFAALTVAVVALPQSMAYALVAGIDPKYGLYASLLPVVVGALWGSSRYLLGGPTNSISMILLATLSQISVAGVVIAHMPEAERMGYVFAIAVLAGAIQVAMGIARLGELVHFVSQSVVAAFTTGAALLIAFGQLKNFFGLHINPAGPAWNVLADTLSALGNYNGWSTGLGLGTLLLVLLFSRIPHAPAPLLALVLSGIVSVIFNLEAKGVMLAGAVERILPPLSLPYANIEILSLLFMPSLAIAIQGAVECSSISRVFAARRGESVDQSQNLLGMGLANIAAGFTSGIPGSGSFTRSAVNFMSGARTRFAGVFSALFTLLLILLLAPWVHYIPIPALAAILLLIAWNMLDFRLTRFSLRATTADRWVWLSTFAAAMLLELDKVVFVGVFFSLALFLHREAHPTVQRISRNELRKRFSAWAADCPYLSAYRVEGTLFFGAVHELEQRLYDYESFTHRVIILNLKRVHWLDATGATTLATFLQRCKERGLELIISGANRDVLQTLERCELLGGTNNCYAAPDMPEALALSRALLHSGPWAPEKACERTEGSCAHCQHKHEAVDFETLPPQRREFRLKEEKADD